MADDVNIEGLEELAEAQNWIAAPISAENLRMIEIHGFFQGPARRLDDATFDLIAYAVGMTAWPLSTAATARLAPRATRTAKPSKTRTVRRRIESKHPVEVQPSVTPEGVYGFPATLVAGGIFFPTRDTQAAIVGRILTR